MLRLNLVQQIRGCAIRFSTDAMIWQSHRHHKCILLRSINIAQRNKDKVSIQLPTWLQLRFVTACTMGYCRLILAGCDDSSVVIACHLGALTLLEEERQRDLPSNLSLPWLIFVTAH
jgi:hypothetical protein